MPGLYGPSFGRHHLRKAVEDTLKLWMPDYLAEAERVNDLKPRTLLNFETYEHVNEFRNWADDETPVCIIVSPGLAAAKQKGAGEYTGIFDLGVAAILGANNRENTDKLADLYGPILRQLLLQQASLGGVATGIDYVDEKYNDVPDGQDSPLSSAQVIFTVEVPGIVNGRKGTIAPSEDPYGDDGEASLAKEVNLDVNEETIHVDDEEEEDEVGP